MMLSSSSVSSEIAPILSNYKNAVTPCCSPAHFSEIACSLCI